MKIAFNVYEKEKVITEKTVQININDKKYDIAIPDVKDSVLLEPSFNQEIPYEKISTDDKTLYLYTEDEQLYITNRLNRIWNRRSFLKSKLTRKNAWFFGYYTDISSRFEDCDNVYLGEEIVGKVKRPFKFLGFANFAVIKVSLLKVAQSGEIHSIVSIGDSKGCKMDLTIRKKHRGMNYYNRKKVGKNYYIIRSVITNSHIRIVNIPMSPEYKKINMLKNNVAWFLSKFIGKKDIVLMFEKEGKKAGESGYYVFEQIMARKDLKSKVYFIIDKTCDDFKKVYKKYPKNTLKKYSFRHFLYIYLSKYFVSSELSNHVINPRLYIKNLNYVIAKKPLVFLQHGIMFAKPVDNPAAEGFRKSNPFINYYKSVISSDLEATQFYKCGFVDKDLIKCGLPKFDISTMNPDADKIMVMLTYRYWEEGLVMNPETITQTTYYQTYMNIINAFEKAGLLDRLIISCHPKFAECIISAAPKYASIVVKDVNHALENSKIFITDYSSASYDAHYRGAYVIYYWEERDYLIENYQAIPPVNEDNCDGVPVFSMDALVSEVQNAIKNDYKMDSIYEERYTKINEYHDNRNGERLVDELQRLNII